MSSKPMIVVLVVVILAALGLIGYKVFGGGGTPTPEYDPTGLPPSRGWPTGFAVFEDGARLPITEVNAKMNPDGTYHPYQVEAPGHGVGYQEYQCLETKKTWLYGKDGVIRSPWATK